MFDFPSSPTEGQIFTPPGGPRYVFKDSAWRAYTSPIMTTALARNRIVNGAFQITQEYVRSTNHTGSGAYFADQWFVGFSSDGTLSGFACVPNTFLGADAGPYCGTLLIGTADAAMAAAQWLQFLQPLEGTRISDFKWGTSDARPVVLRFKATSSIATTFAVAIKNGTVNNRSYVKNCVIAANTPTWFTIAIPGDTTGTWNIDNTWALSVAISLAAGTNFQAPSEGAWVAGAFVATAATGNFWATAGARFSVGAVGLYLDPDGTGLPPKWEIPDEAEELQACQRYWESQVAIISAAAANTASRTWLAQKRVAPTLTVTPVSGSGGTYAVLDQKGWYQGTVNSVATTGTAVGNARM